MSRASNRTRTGSSVAANAANGCQSDVSREIDNTQTDTTTDVEPVVPTLDVTITPDDEPDSGQLGLPVWTTAPLMPFLTDLCPFRRRSKKGVEIARHMLPGWAPRAQMERELAEFVRVWVGND